MKEATIKEIANEFTNLNSIKRRQVTDSLICLKHINKFNKFDTIASLLGYSKKDNKFIKIR